MAGQGLDLQLPPGWPPSLMPRSCFGAPGLQFVIDIYLSEFNGL